MSPVWWVVLAGLLLLAVTVAVIGHLRVRWLLLEEARAYAAEEPEPGVVTVTLRFDTRGFNEAMRQVAAAAQNMANQLSVATKVFQNWTPQSLDRLREEMEWRAYLDRQSVLARKSATLGVRAGLDPYYRTLDALHELVSHIIMGLYDGRYRLTGAERRELAVAAMHGWAHGWGRNQPRPVLADVRHYGNATVTVVSP